MSATIFGFGPPFIGGPQNILSRQVDDRLIKNDILQLLLTVPGERVMRPTFGTRLRTVVFDQLDSITILQLQNEVSTQIRTQEPRVNLLSVTLTPDQQRQGLSVQVIVSLKTNPLQLLQIDTFINGSPNA